MAPARASNGTTASRARELRRTFDLLARTEPYYACARWRRAPYDATPYEGLGTGEYVPGVGVSATDAETLFDRLRTSTSDGWTDVVGHAEDANGGVKREVDEDAGSGEVSVVGNRVVRKPAAPITSREALGSPMRLGVDVEERPLWGVDCYTREAILASVATAPAFAGEDRRDKRVEFFAKRLLPKLHTLGDDGWDAAVLAERVLEDAIAEGDEDAAAASRALLWAIHELDDADAEKRANESTKKKAKKAKGDTSTAVQTAQDAVSEVELVPKEHRVQFRIHPKGTGVVCINPNGLKAGTLVNYYIGEMYPPWQWYERQDAIKKSFPNMNLPSFFNITLERPAHDERGRHVIFVEAMHKGSFASRLSHSCEPNCQTVTFTKDGKLTLGMFTVRDIAYGEEMTWDYSCITESAEEYRTGFCLCSSPGCRGSFLTYAGNGAFTAIVNKKHSFLHRNAILFVASTTPLTKAESESLYVAGIRQCALEKCPDWVVKWAALTLQYIKLEEKELPDVLMKLPVTEYGRYDEIGAKYEAAGVASTRITNLVVTLDKIRYVLNRPGQRRDSFFRALSDDEVIDYLWSGEASVFRRFIITMVNSGGDKRNEVRSASMSTEAMFEKTWTDTRVASALKAIKKSVNVVDRPETAEQARARLLQVRAALEHAGDKAFHAQARDLLWLHANTLHYFTIEKFDLVLSPPVNIDDMKSQISCEMRTKLPNAVKGNRDKLLQKKYGPLYVWGQLVTWYKQTVYAPDASLSADRRGSLSLPDPESCYSAVPTKYTSSERRSLIKLMRSNIHAMWPTTMSWSFKNPTKVYGSPMFDEALRETFPKEYASGASFQSLLGEFERS